MEPSTAQKVAAAVALRLNRVFDMVDVHVVVTPVQGVDTEFVKVTVPHRNLVLGLSTAISEVDELSVKDSAGYIDVLAGLISRRTVDAFLETEQ